MCILEHFALGTVEALFSAGEKSEQPALVYGDFAITPNVRGHGYAVTLVSCGRGYGSFSTPAEAARFVAFLNGLGIDFEIHNTNPAATGVELYGAEGNRRSRIALKYWRSLDGN